MGCWGPKGRVIFTNLGCWGLGAVQRAIMNVRDERGLRNFLICGLCLFHDRGEIKVVSISLFRKEILCGLIWHEIVLFGFD